MKKKFIQLFSLVGVFSLLSFFPFSESIAQTTLTYSYTGSAQAFTVPSCVTTLTITARGAAGGSAGYTGGEGGVVKGVITVTPGQVYNLYVGGQGSVTAGGFNGGGAGGVSPASSGGGGGGGTDIRFGGIALTNRIMAAAGGGGSGGSTSYNATPGVGGGGSACTSPLGVGGGGAGGCATGSNGGCLGGAATSYGTGGGGAGVGGGAPTAGSSTGTFGGAGTAGIGGDGGSYTGATFCNGGGGGGGGYYGGAGGMSGSGGCNGGGGGGSSYADVNYFSSVTFTAGSQTAHGSIVISYIPIGTSVTAVASPTAICNGNSVNLTASGVVTYTWLPVGSFAGSNSSSVSVNPSSNTTYTVLGTNANSCISQKLVTVTVSPSAPVLSINSSTNNICLGQNVTLTASGALTYTWTGGVTNGQAFAPTSTSAYTVAGQNGCGTTSAVTSVSVSALPVTTLATPTIVCAGTTSTLMAASSVNGYTWQPLSLVGQSVIVSPIGNTVYTVTASDGTCSGTATLALATNPVPTLSIAYTSSMVCENALVTMSVSGANSYTWTANSTSSATGSTYSYSPAGPTLFSATGANSFGCLSTVSQIVLTAPAPNLTVTASQPVVCKGGSVTLTASGADTYTWNPGPQTNVNVQNPTGLTVYSVVGTNTTTNCSSLTKTIQVNVYDPQLTVTSPTLICPGQSVTLNASGGTANTYSWSTGAQLQSISVSPSVPTSYTVTASTTSNNLTCPSSGTTQVGLQPLPTISIVATKTVMCRKDANAVLSGTGGVSYLWNTGAITQTISVSSALVGTYNYTVTGKDANGCENTHTVSVKVNNCTGIEDWDNSANQLSIYPNPNNGNFEVKAATAMDLQLINETGQLIQLFHLNAENDYKVSLTGLSSGIYFVKGQNESQQINQKIIVTR